MTYIYNKLMSILYILFSVIRKLSSPLLIVQTDEYSVYFSFIFPFIMLSSMSSTYPISK